jgi:hypothetical protein
VAVGTGCAAPLLNLAGLIDRSGRQSPAAATGRAKSSSPATERARSQASPILDRAFLLTDLLTAVINRPHRAGEDGRRLGELFADHVGVDPQGDRRIGMSGPGRDDVYPPMVVARDAGMMIRRRTETTTGY